MTHILALALGMVLIASAAGKLRDGAAFVDAVREFDMLPAPLVKPFARLLPPAEFAIGAMLVLGVWPALTAALAALILTSFAIALGVNAWRGRTLDCHCFGASGEHRIGWQSIARDAVLLVAALLVLAAALAGWRPVWPADLHAALTLLGLAALLALAYMQIAAGIDLLQNKTTHG